MKNIMREKLGAPNIVDRSTFAAAHAQRAADYLHGLQQPAEVNGGRRIGGPTTSLFFTRKSRTPVLECGSKSSNGRKDRPV